MKISKTQQKTLELIDLYQEFELIEYIRGKSSKVRLKCLKCGNEFERYAQHFNDYPHICPKCHPKGISTRITLEEAQRRIDNVYGEHVLQILEYKGNNQKVKVKCLRCNENFESVPASLWRHRIKGCPKCTEHQSLGEKRIRELLEYKKIQYIPQYRFENCKYKQSLPFDFYLPQKNICIEFQGEQHYNACSLYYSDIQKIRDDIKKEYCERNNIRLILIPYWDINNIETYLSF